MEDSSQLTLEQRIAQWRESLSNRPSLRGEDVEELESHLRDTIDDLSHKGLSAEEAFLVAARRAGVLSELEHQYEVVNPASSWKPRALWMTTGVLLYWMMMSMNGVISSVSLVLVSYFSMDESFSAAGGVMLQMTFFAAFVFAIARLTRKLNMVSTPSRKVVSSLGVIILVLLVLKLSQFGLFELARSHSTLSSMGAQFAFSAWATFAQTMGIVGISIMLGLTLNNETRKI